MASSPFPVPSSLTRCSHPLDYPECLIVAAAFRERVNTPAAPLAENSGVSLCGLAEGRAWVAGGGEDEEGWWLPSPRIVTNHTHTALAPEDMVNVPTD